MSNKKTKIELEYEIHSSVYILFQYISTSSGLTEWFADDVISKRGVDYTFVWEGSQEVAKKIEIEHEEFITFQWYADEGTDYYFRLKILVDEITNDVSLLITDFATPEELETLTLFWNNSISELKHSLGSI